MAAHKTNKVARLHYKFATLVHFLKLYRYILHILTVHQYHAGIKYHRLPNRAYWCRSMILLAAFAALWPAIHCSAISTADSIVTVQNSYLHVELAQRLDSYQAEYRVIVPPAAESTSDRSINDASSVDSGPSLFNIAMRSPSVARYSLSNTSQQRITTGYSLLARATSSARNARDDKLALFVSFKLPKDTKVLNAAIYARPASVASDDTNWLASPATLHTVLSSVFEPGENETVRLLIPNYSHASQVVLCIKYSGKIQKLPLYEQMVIPALSKGGLFKYSSNDTEFIGCFGGSQQLSILPTTYTASAQTVQPQSMHLEIVHPQSYQLLSSSHAVERLAIRSRFPWQMKTKSTALLHYTGHPNDYNWILVADFFEQSLDLLSATHASVRDKVKVFHNTILNDLDIEHIRQAVYRFKLHDSSHIWFLHIPSIAFAMRSVLPLGIIPMSDFEEYAVNFGVLRSLFEWQSLIDGRRRDLWLLDAYSVLFASVISEAKLSFSHELTDDERIDRLPLSLGSPDRANAVKGMCILRTIFSTAKNVLAYVPFVLALPMEFALLHEFLSMPQSPMPPIPLTILEEDVDEFNNWILQPSHPIITIDVTSNDHTVISVTQRAPFNFDQRLLWLVDVQLVWDNGLNFKYKRFSENQANFYLSEDVKLLPLNVHRQQGFYRVRYTSNAVKSGIFVLHYPAALQMVLNDAFATWDIADFVHIFSTAESVLRNVERSTQAQLDAWTCVRANVEQFFLQDTVHVISSRQPIYDALRNMLLSLRDTVDTLDAELLGGTSISSQVAQVYLGLLLQFGDKPAVELAEKLFATYFDARNSHPRPCITISSAFRNDLLRAAEMFGGEREWLIVSHLRSGWRNPGDSLPTRVTRHYARRAIECVRTLFCNPLKLRSDVAFFVAYIQFLLFNWITETIWYELKGISTAASPTQPYWDAWFAFSNHVLQTFGLTYLCYITVEPQNNVPAWFALVLYRAAVYLYQKIQFFYIVTGQRVVLAAAKDIRAISQSSTPWTDSAEKANPVSWRLLRISYDRYADNKRVRKEKYEEPLIGRLDDDSDDDNQRIDRETRK